jgi:adenylate cyclase
MRMIAPSPHVLSFSDPSSPRFELRCWGEFRLFDRRLEEDCTPQSRKARAILVFLAARSGTSVNRERLSALLWSERGDQQARASLRQTLFELRPYATDAARLLVIERYHIRLDSLALTSDLARLEVLARVDDLDALSEALAETDDRLFGGLDGLDPAFDEWLAQERRLQQDRLLRLATASAVRGLEDGRYEQVSRLTNTLEVLDPINEAVAQIGMKADHACGDRSAVRRRRQRLCEALKRELGVHPSQETEVLFGELIASSSGSESEAAALPAAVAVSSATHQPSVVVLPFLNISDDPLQTYFSDGMTEDLITDLSKVSALSVLARTTSFALRDATTPIPELAERLGVSHVLEGSVRKAGGRVRVTAQLVDCASGSHLWAERFDRPVADVFAVQDELSCAIVEALRVKLLPEERRAIEQRRTHSAEAYELYLLARRYYEGGGSDSSEQRQLEAIERLCRRAVTLDPEFAQAWALMAVAQTAMLCHLSNPTGDGGGEAIKRALALDPEQAEPHAVSARNLLQDWRMDEARAELELALRLDPDSVLVRAVAGRFHYMQHDFAAAIPHLEYSTNASAIWAADAGLLLSAYHWVGDADGVRSAAQRVYARTEEILARDYINLSGLGCGVGALAALGEVDRARALAERALLIAPENARMRYNFACGMSCFVGDNTAALELLQPMFEECTAGLLRHVVHDPDLAPLRDDPRFVAMITAAAERLGMSGMPS